MASEVQPQPGLFYGGWITSDVVGPFKGEPGTNRCVAINAAAEESSGQDAASAVAQG